MKGKSFFKLIISVLITTIFLSGQVSDIRVFAKENTVDSEAELESESADDDVSENNANEKSEPSDSDDEENPSDEDEETVGMTDEAAEISSEEGDPDPEESYEDNCDDNEESDAHEEAITDNNEPDESDEEEADDSDWIVLSYDYVNPIYEGIITADDLNKPELSPEYEEISREEYSHPGYKLKSNPFTTVEDAGDFVRDKMEARVETISFDYQMPAGSDDETLSALLYSVCDEAIKHTGVPTQGDYIGFQYGGWSANISANRRTGLSTYTYTMTYYTTAEQEEEETEAVNALLDSLDLAGKSKYERLTTIYDYICTHVTYDHDHLGNDEYTLQFTSYAALMNGTAVCQGYSVLLYRLLLSSGIDCRIIAGKGNGGAHAWNIVGLSGKYYNVDSTWDTSYYNSDYHHWFMKSENNFSNHSRNDEYTTEAFNTEFPMGTEDYVYTEPEYRQGDVNGDDKVNAADRIYLARYLAGWSGYVLEDAEAADVNDDNKVNAADRIYLARYLAGWRGYTIG